MLYFFVKVGNVDMDDNEGESSFASQPNKLNDNVDASKTDIGKESNYLKTHQRDTDTLSRVLLIINQNRT